MGSHATGPTASEGSTLLPGQSPPLSTITPTDQGGVLIIATCLGLVFAFISLLIRLFIRFEFHSKFAKDDIASFFSMVFAVVQSSLVFVAVSRGFGKAGNDISPVDAELWQKDIYVSEVFYILTMWLTKCSVAFLFLRLSPDRIHNIASYVLLGASTIFMVVSVLVVTIRCNIAHPWILVAESCPSLFPRWQTVTIFDIFTEVGLFGIALLLVQGLQLPLSKKFVVMTAFALRLPVTAPAVLRLNYLGVQFSSSDPSLDGVIAAVCTQIELCYAIVATTTPCLRPFMSALNTHYGGPATIKTPSGTEASNISSGNEYPMTKLSAGSKVRAEKKDESPVPATRWDSVEYGVAITTGDHDQDSLQSNDSKKMIISKNTEWAVDYEDQDRHV